MTILVTGATGYVGRRVASRLIKRGEAVVGVVRSPERASALPAGVQPLIADLVEVDRLVEAARSATAVIHTAFDHRGDWFAGVESEKRLVSGWAEVLAGTPTRLIVSNGTGFYGDAGGRFLDESASIPADHPAAVRALSTRAATQTEGLHGIELRLASFVYGDGGSVFLPPLMIAAQRTGRALYVGEGNNRLSSVHVDAAADAYVAALDQGRAGSIYFIASDEAPPMRDLASAIAIGSGSTALSVTMEEAAAALDPFTAMFLALDNGLSSAKARREIGWLPAGYPGLLWDVAHGSYASAARASSSHVGL